MVIKENKNLRYRMLVAVILITTITNISFGQEIIDRIAMGNTIKITSLELAEDRYAYVYLPLGYENSKESYPVIYLLDGNGHFHHGSGIAQFLSNQNRMPRSIVVAIPNTNRNRDFTPTKDPTLRNSGGADNFLDFMEKELIPFINKSFRTQDHRILFGHSLTAMFTVYALSSRPHLFNSYIAASPYLMYNDGFAIKKMETFLDNANVKNKTLFMTIGNEPNYVESMEQITALLEDYPDSGIQWKFVQMKSEDHGSIPHKTIYDGLEFIYSDWRIPAEKMNDLSYIEYHYKKISKKFGYKIEVPENVLNNFGYRIMGGGDIEYAIKIFKRNVERYPESANVYDSLGEALEANNEMEKAIKNYQKAIELGKKNTDPNTQIFEEHLFNARQKKKQAMK